MRFVRKEAVQPGNVHLKGRSPYTSLGRDFLLCAATDADAVEWMCGTVGCNLPYRRDTASRCCEYEDGEKFWCHFNMDTIETMILKFKEVEREAINYEEER